MRSLVLPLALTLMPIAAAKAHYHMLPADRPSVKAGATVSAAPDFAHLAPRKSD